MNISTEFNTSLAIWFDKNRREMPWRHSKEPYKIWLSEIILQQTQIVQGTPYYNKFIKYYPNLKHLAKADEEEVLKHWQGLGYYTRARNLLFTAKYIYFNLNGNFPNTYKELKKLKGVGNYTAAAIASICFEEPIAVVDGNVIRVISRLFSIKEPYKNLSTQKRYQELANQILGKFNPGIHNQAMMELGSLICKPQNPLCDICPVSKHCSAFINNSVLQYPIVIKKPNPIKLYYAFIVIIVNRNKIWITKRKEKNIWQNLYTFPFYESKAQIDNQELTHFIRKDFVDSEISSVKKMEHKLTHRVINATFFLIQLKESEQFKKKDIFEVEIKKLSDFYSLPRLITKYLESDEIKAYFDS